MHRGINDDQQEYGVAADVSLASAGFAGYGKLGFRTDSVDDEEGFSPSSSSPSSAREQLSREAARLMEHQREFSVRDLASRFEKGQAAAQAAVAKLSQDVLVKEGSPSCDHQALLQQLHDVLESLRGRVAGCNKDDAEEALTMIEALSGHLKQREVELAQEKMEVRKLAALFKQASDDAKRMVDEARAVAMAEIESARLAVKGMEDGLAEREGFLGLVDEQELKTMQREVQEARRIKMLHESSKVMDMEHELEGLRQQLVHKTLEISALRKELQALRTPDMEKSNVFLLDGMESLGSCLQVTEVDEGSLDILKCRFQWHRISVEGNKAELISGATKSQYAPEPFDVGRLLRVDITLPNGEMFTMSTLGVIDPAPGLGNYVEALVRKGGAEFQVVIIQQNGEVASKQNVHGLNIGRVRMKLRKGRTTKAKEPYSASMQLCGARGGGLAAAQGLFWQAKKGLSYVLAFESARERNAAIMLGRRFAFDCNIMLAGPDDRAALGT